MGVSCKTVWTEVVEGRLVVVTRPEDKDPPADQANPPFVMTNDTKALDGLAAAGTIVSAEDLYRFAFPASGAETLEQMAAEQGSPAEEIPADALWRIWRTCEARLASLPHWALEHIAILLQETEDIALAKLISAFADQIRLSGRNCGAWSDSFPVEAPRNDKRKLPTLADCTPLTADRLAAFAAADGALARIIPDYEARPGQQDMIRAVTTAINEGKHLMVEAGTGVGKSIGYLVPAVAWSMLNDTPVVVSTNTRNLQTQLIEKDIPLIRAALGPERGAQLRAVLLKGRSNYLCLRHFGLMLDQGMLDLDRAGLRQLARAIAWAAQTTNGDLDMFSGGCGVDGSFTSTLGSLGEECAGRACRHFRRCFVRRVREQAGRAHVVVANHALVFVDAGDAGGVLPPHSQIIFDEAHNLEAAATRHFSIEITPGRLRLLLRRIFSENKGRRASGILENLRKQLEQGGITGQDGERKELRRLAREAKTSLTAVRQAGNDFFEALPLTLQKGRETARIRGKAGAQTTASPESEVEAEAAADWLGLAQMDTAGEHIFGMLGTSGTDATTRPEIAAEIQRDGTFRPWGETAGREEVATAAARFTNALRRTAGLLDALATALRIGMDNELGLYADQMADVGGAALTLKGLASDICFALAASDTDYVYWVTQGRRIGRTARGRLAAETGELWAAPS